MKNAAKVFIWIKMILFFYLIYPVVVGIIALNKLEEAKSKDDIKTIGILTLLFCSLFGGIFMLSLEDKDFNPDLTIVKRERKTFKRVYSKEFFRIIINLSLVFLALVASFFLHIFLWPYRDWQDHIILLIYCFFSGPMLFIIFLFTLINVEKLKKIIKILLIILSISIFVIALMTFFITNGWGYYYTPIKFSSFILWVVFLFLIFSLVNCVLALKNLKRDNILLTIIKLEAEGDDDYLAIMKKEIGKLDNLLNEKIIEEDEYKQLRKSVIDKYSKV